MATTPTPVTKLFGTKVPSSLVILNAGAGGNAANLVNLLTNEPSDTNTRDLNNIISTVATVTPLSLTQFLSHFNLDTAGKQVLANEFKDASVTEDNVVSKLLKSVHANKHFPAPGSGPAFLPRRAPNVNPVNGLSLLLVNPDIARAIMAERKKKSQMIAARPAVRGALLGGPFGVMGPGVTVRISGGAMESLSSDYPIEMRGAGYDIGMSGGQALLGPWRQPGDDFFIAEQLEDAVSKLKSSLTANNKTLESNTEGQITALITALKDAEQKVKDKRDELNLATTAINSGSMMPKGKKNSAGQETNEIDQTGITALADQYNQANAHRQKLENKLFRVIIALNNNQVFP